MAPFNRRRLAFLPIALAFVLASCSGGGPGASAGSAGAVPPVMQDRMSPIAVGADDESSMLPFALHAVNITPGGVDGTAGMFHPKAGDMPGGGHGQAIGKTLCAPMEYLSDYHIHAYLGLVVNGKLYALPEAIGLKNPAPAEDGFIYTAGCFYYIHTHDQSGLIHIEDPRNLPPSTAIYPLSQFLKVWGLKTTADSFGTFKGAMRVFTGNVATLGDTEVDSYTRYANASKLGSIILRSHEVIWVEIGKPYVAADRLPSVTFYTEY
jgi:hypothetical protein